MTLAAAPAPTDHEEPTSPRTGTAVVLYFHVHQPERLRRYGYFDIGRSDRYFDDGGNAAILRRVAERCYLPMTAVLRRLAERHGSEGDAAFRCAFSITGTAIDQMERWSPESLEAFQALVDTGSAEVVAETSHHSLAFTGDLDEFRAQITSHTDRLERLFGRRPTTFRNTELIIDSTVASIAEELGFTALLGEGADHLLGWLPPTGVYRPTGTHDLKLLLRQYELSDDIAFRFSNRAWAEWPLSAAKFTRWMHRVPTDARQVGLFMDFETAGEHQWADTGILDFMELWPTKLLESGRFRFRTPSQVAAETPSDGDLDLPFPVSWADAERDMSAWLGNPMQFAAHEALYDALPMVREAARAGAPELLAAWRHLSTSDHVYYMCTKHWSDGDVHAYFSPYESPHTAHVLFMNVLDDLTRRAAAVVSAAAPTASTPIQEPA